MRVSRVIRNDDFAVRSSCKYHLLGKRRPKFAAAGCRRAGNILKQLDTQAADFRSLTADLERTKVTVVVNDKSTDPGKSPCAATTRCALS